MKSKVPAMIVLTVVILLVTGLAQVSATRSAAPSLVRIAWQGGADLAKVEALAVPVYARLVADEGTYLLAGATPSALQKLRTWGMDVSVLDADMQDATYYLAYAMPNQTRLDWEAYGRLLHKDSGQILLRMTSKEVERLAETGARLRLLTLDPKPLVSQSTGMAIPTVIQPDPVVQEMVDQVDSAIIFEYTNGLSGEEPVEVGGLPYTIATRHTESGIPIQQATQYVGEHLAALSLDVEYHDWSYSGYVGRNVIGELAGKTNPDDIFIICAHVDDMPSGPIAPGADDNASGSVAVLVAADILTQYQWGCTLRFALWTGEEQGLLGSSRYAQRAFSQGENIVGVLNLDMIAWDAQDGPDIDLHARSSIPATLDLAYLFADVVDAYDLDLVPQIVGNGTGGSDHASFWDYGYPALLGIEDFSDFNDYYHTANDRVQYLNKFYYTDFVKASLGTFVHMTDCLIQPRYYYVPLVIRDAAESSRR